MTEGALSEFPHAHVSLQEVAALREHRWHVYFVRFSPDASRLISVSCEQSRERYLYEVIGIWDVQQHRLLRLIEDRVETGNIFDVAFSPDGTLFASACENGTVRLRNRDGDLVGVLPDQGSAIRALAFTSDGTFLITGDASGQVHIWDIATQQPLFAFSAIPDSDTLPEGHQFHRKHRISDLTVSPDSRFLAVAAPSLRGRIQLWSLNIAEQKAAWVDTLIDLTSIANTTQFSPDGRLLLCLVNEDGNDDVWVYGTRNFAFQERIWLPSIWSSNNEIAEIAFSFDSQMLAIADSDGTLWIWDAATSKLIASCVAYPSTREYNVLFVALATLDWIRTGNLIATGGWEPLEPPESDALYVHQQKMDMVIKLWQVVIEDTKK